MSQWPTIPGETPIDDISGLKIKSVRTRAALNLVGEHLAEVARLFANELAGRKHWWRKHDPTGIFGSDQGR